MSRTTALFVRRIDGKKAEEGRFCLRANFISIMMIAMHLIIFTQILETATDKTTSKTFKANIFRIA
jgi:hypothetical protein